MSNKVPEVVIIGGGFAGLNVAKALAKAPVHVTLVDRRNFHLFQPLLYQVATASLSPGNIASPLRSILKKQPNTRVLMDEAEEFDLRTRRVFMRHLSLPYDYLVIAAGASHNYFGHPEWEQLAPGLKTVEDALTIRQRIFSAFELAEREVKADVRKALLTFVIVGSGPTGVELAGALAEIAHDTLRHEFRSIHPSEAKIVLVDAVDKVLPAYPPELSDKAQKALTRLGVTVRPGCLVTDLKPSAVTLQSNGQTEVVATCTVFWAAGVRASPLGIRLARQAGIEPDRAGRIKVQADLSVPGYPNIWVIGDLALAVGPTGTPLPGTAPVAIQEGRYVAHLIQKRLEGKTLPAFRYLHRGDMATIGRAAGVADLGWIRFNGYLAWIAWLFIHLLNIVTLERKILVFTQWIWSYLTHNRSARLITGDGSTSQI